MKPIFNLGLLRNYQMVDVPGTYMVSVAYTINSKSLILDEHPRYIVPLRTLTYKGLSEILKLLKDDTESVPFSNIKHLFSVGVLWQNDIDEDTLPIKGEKVLASFDYKNNNLICTHIELLPRKDLKYIDLNNILLFRKTINDLITTKTNF